MNSYDILQPVDPIRHDPVGRSSYEHGVSRLESRGYSTDEEGNEIRYPWEIYMSDEESTAFTDYVEVGVVDGLSGFHRMNQGHFRKEYDKIQTWRAEAVTALAQATDDVEAYSAEKRLTFWTELSDRIEADHRLWATIQGN